MEDESTIKIKHPVLKEPTINIKLVGTVDNNDAMLFNKRKIAPPAADSDDSERNNKDRQNGKRPKYIDNEEEEIAIKRRVRRVLKPGNLSE